MNEKLNFIWRIVKWPIVVLMGCILAYLLLILAAGFIFGNNLTGEE